MITLKKQLIRDRKGKAIAVVVDLKTFEKIEELLEDLKDVKIIEQRIEEVDTYLDLPKKTAESFEPTIPLEENGTESDPLYNEAVQIVIKNQEASIGIIQRKLSIGYAHAGRLIDVMERNGIIGPSEGSKSRKILVKDLPTDLVNTELSET